MTSTEDLLPLAKLPFPDRPEIVIQCGDSSVVMLSEGGFDVIQKPLYKIVPLLQEVEFAADLFVLHPSCIKAGVDAMSMALGLMSEQGEGVMATDVQSVEAIYWDSVLNLRGHVWATLDLDGSALMYFAKGHQGGRQQDLHPNTFFDALQSLQALKRGRYRLRQGRTIDDGDNFRATVAKFAAVREEMAARDSGKRFSNLWIGDGKITTAITSFQEHSKCIPRRRKDVLLSMSGRKIMDVVATVAGRASLRDCVACPWIVSPDTMEAVACSFGKYNSLRAPIIAQSPMKRIAHLEDYATIKCVKDLGDFKAGETYPLKTEDVLVERRRVKPHSDGTDHEMLQRGKELLVLVNGESFIDKRWMDAQFLSVSMWRSEAPKPKYSFDELVECFEMPAVPCVAEAMPERYRENLEKLREIERLMNLVNA